MAHESQNIAFYTNSSNATPTDAIVYSVIDNVKTYTLTKDVTITNLTKPEQHDINMYDSIRLGPGEVFDGGRFTIYIEGAKQYGLFSVDSSTNPVGTNRAFDDNHRCVIKNLTVDVSGNNHSIGWKDGGLIRRAHTSSLGNAMGILVENCICKRAIIGMGSDTAGAASWSGFGGGGFFGVCNEGHHNITIKNCIHAYPKDFKAIGSTQSSTELVEGGFVGQGMGIHPTPGSQVQRWELDGCISYIELTDTTIDWPIQIRPDNNTVYGTNNDRHGAFAGGGAFGANTTRPIINNCYVLFNVGGTFTAHGLEDGGTSSFGNVVPLLQTSLSLPASWDYFRWRPRTETHYFTLTPTDGSTPLNTAFQSTPWDSSEYDDSTDLPVFLTAGSSGSSGGDPYIFPLKSNIPVKLPNTKAVYRMFEQGNTFINAQVDRAAPEHMIRMIKYAEKLTPVTHNIITDGFFYSKFFIHAEGHEIIIDLVSKKVHMTEEGKKFFTMKQLKTRFDDGEFDEDAFTYRIKWNVKNYGRVALDVLFFPNPHIENGIKIRVGDLKNATGMLIDNYKPKLMKLPSISTLKYDKLHRRLNNTENVFQKKAIKGKNEKWHLKK